MSSREQFEAWIAGTTNSDLHRGIMLDRHENGRYRHLATENKWEAWQEATKQSEAKCAALAAENAGLKEACGGDGSYRDCPACAHSEYIEAPDTPATDAFLAEMRAQGVEMLTTKLQQLIDEGNFEGDEVGLIAGAVYTGADIAAQLRQEAAQ
ncbi:TPA: hypothetical protein QHA92_003870 [Enterobacter kobei]|nr:hypothetical protein [Enterobacter kobei]